MKTYIITADSHSFLQASDHLKAHLERVDGIIHLGDHAEDLAALVGDTHKEMYAVLGNCDEETPGHEEWVFEVEGKKVLMTHGHLYRVKASLTYLFYRGKEVGADVVLFGHTHVPHTECVENMWFHNPGSLAIPKGGSKKSYSVMTIGQEGIAFDSYTL